MRSRRIVALHPDDERLAADRGGRRGPGLPARVIAHEEYSTVRR
ncbi:hypothetical protein [Kitasatospora brasiliensis]|nr:hypothetical protein [Kitasatospora sp. K002]